MKDKIHSERSHLKRKSLRAYSSRVFQESTIGVVSSAVQTESKSRKVFKVFAFLLCLTGFLYQGAKYLYVVFQYPTSISIDVTRPNEYTLPAYTFCDNNGINRRLFCEKYPDRCEEPIEDFCDEYPYYCGENKTLVPKKRYYSYHNFLEIEEVIDINAKKDDFIQNYRGSRDYVTGPHIRIKDMDSFEFFLCYSINDRVNSSLYPLTFTPNRMASMPVDKISLRIRPDEMFIPGNRAGIVFDLHSPFQAVNPFKTGTFLKTGRTYMIYVTMEEQISERSPYDTDCINYTEIWEQNGRSGPQSQEMCAHNCYSEMEVECFGCNLPFHLFPRHEKFCSINDAWSILNNCQDSHFQEIIEECHSKCKQDCREIKYRYTVQERFKGHYDQLGEKIPEISYETINIEIRIEEDEVKVYRYSPKYMTVEAFSSIGGFIGIWLGMSLLDITDVFEAFIRIFWYSFKKIS